MAGIHVLVARQLLLELISAPKLEAFVSFCGCRDRVTLARDRPRKRKQKTTTAAMKIDFEVEIERQ